MFIAPGKKVQGPAVTQAFVPLACARGAKYQFERLFFLSKALRFWWLCFDIVAIRRNSQSARRVLSIVPKVPESMGGRFRVPDCLLDVAVTDVMVNRTRVHLEIEKIPAQQGHLKDPRP